MNYFNLRKKILLTISIISMAFLLCSCTPNTMHSKDGFYFDTIIEITIYDSISQKSADKILTSCMEICEKYEHLFSRTLPGSDIYRFNNETDSLINANHETCLLVKEALSYAEKTNGLADPTIGNLSDLWDISPSFVCPSDNDINNALTTVNYKKVHVDCTKDTISKDSPDIALDLGFIAKGYIADSLKSYLINEGIRSAIINLGGNILCIGQKPDGNDFKIGIKNPQNPNGNPLTSISINNKSVVSSGDYERFTIIDGHKYHHIISTKNGYPVDNDLSEVTIINDSSCEGDALSTICFILGYKEAQTFLENNYPSVKYIFVGKDGNILAQN